MSGENCEGKTPIRPGPVLLVAAAAFVMTGFMWWVARLVVRQLEEVSDDSSQEETDDDSLLTEPEQVSGIWRMRAAATTPEEEEVVEVTTPAPAVETVVEVIAPEPVLEPTPGGHPTYASRASDLRQAGIRPTPEPEPTNCVFVNGNRPKVGEKFILKCAEGEFLAVAEYLGGGRFEFTDFEPHVP